ncbi:MAG: 50S ribosomal protein L25/general stress protein Ctc [Deltaproteobacteria bacterium]|nr:50S ribosomal protein L25/general stress protein Ctc [Deltaproteobacteria bacterium]
MKKIELKTKLRTTVGNGPARVLRREGLIPAVLYGPDTETIMLSVPTRALELVTKSANVGQLLLNLTIEGDATVTKTAMVRELQTHPLSGDLIHVDFYEVDMSRKITVNVPIVTTGTSKGVEMGGMLQLVRRELEVLCLPDEIPEAIEVDITDLEIGDSLHVEEIVLGDNVEMPADVNFTVMTVLAPVAEEEEEEEEGEEEEGVEAEAGEEAGEAATDET